MTIFTSTTLGTWTKGTDRITAAYFDVDAIRLSNSAGETWTVTEREWLDRYDGLRDSGWHKAA